MYPFVMKNLKKWRTNTIINYNDQTKEEENTKRQPNSTFHLSIISLEME